MKLLTESEDLKALNIEIALDEGLAREDGAMTVFYGERHVFWPQVSFRVARNFPCLTINSLLDSFVRIELVNLSKFVNCESGGPNDQL